MTRRHLRIAICYLVLVGVSVAPRLYHLGERGLWYDETFSLMNASGVRPGRFVNTLTPFKHADWEVSRTGIIDICDSVRETENTPPLYFLILSIWMAGFGSNESALRALSVLVGVLTIVILPLIGSRIVGPRVAWCAAWLLAVSPLHIYFSREARNYALAGFFATVMLLAWLSAMGELNGGKDESRKGGVEGRLAWMLYAAAACLGLYTNYLIGLLMLAQGVALWALRLPHSSTPSLGSWAIGSTAALLLFIPWLVYGSPAQAAEAVGYREAMAPVDPWLRNTFFFGAKLIVYLFLGETSLKLLFFNLWFLSLPIVGLLAVAALGLWRRRRDAGEGSLGWAAALTCVLYFLGCVAICLATQTWMTVQTRFYVVILPSLAIAIVSGLNSSTPPFFRVRPFALPLLVILTGALFLTPAWPLAARPPEPWQAAAALLDREGRPGDLIVLDGSTAAIPFNTYYRGTLVQLALPPLDTHREGLARKVAVGHPRVWLISSRFRMKPPTRDRLLDGYTLSSTRDFGAPIRLSEYVAR